MRMSSHQVSQAILAVQSMDTDAQEAKSLFRFLTQQVEQLEEGGKPLVSKNVKEVLAALGAATVNTEEVNALTAALKAKE